MQTNAAVVLSLGSSFYTTVINRREPARKGVAIEILYRGICPSDLLTGSCEWSATRYPCIPGHEIVGRVTSVGSALTRFTPDALVGVGCMIESCRTCDACVRGLEQYCEGEHGFLPIHHGYVDGSCKNTSGGYAGEPGRRAVGIPLPAQSAPALSRRRSLTASFIGGMGEMHEMLDFCAQHGIASEIELIVVQDIDEAYTRLRKNDVSYRFVIDMATLKRN